MEWLNQVSREKDVSELRNKNVNESQISNEAITGKNKRAKKKEKKENPNKRSSEKTLVQ